MFIDELRSRNANVPPESVLDTQAELIMQAIPPDASAFTAAKKLVRSFIRARAASKEVAAMSADAQILRGPGGKDPYLVRPDRSQPMVDVILAPGAGQRLRTARDGTFVSLEPGKTTGGLAPVNVYVNADRVGALSEQDGLRYEPALQAAQREDQTLMVCSHISHAPDGTPRMKIYPAGIL